LTTLTAGVFLLSEQEATLKEQTTQTAVRLPDDWLRIVDDEAERLSRSLGVKFNRTDIIRICVAEKFGLTSPTPEVGESQPTT
jgi:hypothetical protein